MKPFTAELIRKATTLLTLSVFICTFLLLPLSPAHAQSTPSSAPTITARLHIPLTTRTSLMTETKSDTPATKHASLLVKDYLSSTRAVVENQPSIISYFYYPYGQLTNSTSLTNSTNSTDKLFTGQRQLDDTGVYHFGSRFYNPQLGIFSQPDRIEGLNRYNYAYNNPAVLNDPTGNCPMCLGALVGGVLSGGLDIAAQTLIEGKSLSDVNWGQVGVSAAVGAASGAVGAGIASNIGKAAQMTRAAKAAGLAADAAAGTVVSTAGEMAISQEQRSKGIGVVARENLVEQSMGVAGGVGVGRILANSSSAIGRFVEDAWQVVDRMTKHVGRRPGCLGGACGLSSDIVREAQNRLSSGGGMRVQAYQIHELFADLFPDSNRIINYEGLRVTDPDFGAGFRHAFNIAQDHKGRAYIVDFTFSQFVRPDGLGTKFGTDPGFVSQMLGTGYVPLSAQSLGRYINLMHPNSVDSVNPSVFSGIPELLVDYSRQEFDRYFSP